MKLEASKKKTNRAEYIWNGFGRQQTLHCPIIIHHICTGYCTYKIKTHLSNGCALHQRTCKTLSAYVLRSVYYVTITEIANKKIRWIEMSYKKLSYDYLEIKLLFIGSSTPPVSSLSIRVFNKYSNKKAPAGTLEL